MAAVDISSDKDYDLNLPFVHHSPYLVKAKDFDTSKDADLLTVATHTIFDVEIGEAFVGFQIVVDTTFTSGGSATLTFNEAGGDALTGAIAVANLASGAVFNFGSQAIAATDGFQGLYAKSAATTITATIGTAAFTAGRAAIIGYFLTNLDNIIV